ncbi:flagellar hook capping FlgD N-terminal domain-containing protein [Methylobacillus pratensis]
MAVDFIGGTTAEQQTTAVQQSTLGQEEFLRILLTQLQYQDPLKPLDNQQFIAQMAQFTSLAQTSEMNDRIDTLLTIQAATQSIGLIGKTVEIQTAANATVGTVTSLAFSEGQPSLTIRTSEGELLTGIRLSQVNVVR